MDLRAVVIIIVMVVPEIFQQFPKENCIWIIDCLLLRLIHQVETEGKNQTGALKETETSRNHARNLQIVSSQQGLAAKHVYGRHECVSI
jgi:hypothetical protein